MCLGKNGICRNCDISFYIGIAKIKQNDSFLLVFLDKIYDI